MPGERFVAGESHKNDGSHSFEENCRSDSNFQAILRLLTPEEICDSCECLHKNSELCYVVSCTSSGQDCDKTLVSKTCCASVCSNVSLTDQDTIWIAGSATAVILLLAVAAFLLIVCLKRRTTAKPNDGEDFSTSTEGHNYLNRNNERPAMNNLEDSSRVQAMLKCERSSASSASSGEPSAPLLEQLTLDDCRVAVLSVLDSSDSLDSEIISRNSPPPTYDEVFADNEDFRR